MIYKWSSKLASGKKCNVNVKNHRGKQKAKQLITLYVMKIFVINSNRGEFFYS